jgi:hypothetical protein
VQEKLTSTSVKAIRKIESRPVVLDALVVYLIGPAVRQLDSNQPKKLTAKITSKQEEEDIEDGVGRERVERDGPKIAVTPIPKAR